MKYTLLFVYVLSIQLLVAQNNRALTINFTSLIDNEVLKVSTQNKNNISIEKLKFYLTNFSLSKDGETIWKEDKSYHLIDVSEPKSLVITLDLKEELEYDAITFLLGTDSLTNVSGVMGGDLDPTKGMYWAWNSGYINFKLEGNSNNIPFEFHLGGYMPPYQTVQKITLKTKNNNRLNIKFNLSEFFAGIDFSKEHKVMSPGNEAQKLSKAISSLFYIIE